jgi:TolB-like protein/Tfp pilus assembly protein PilF
MVTVQLLGGASLRSGDALLSGPPAQRHRVALLALIVAAWPQPLSRDRAMATLWPERDLTNARRLLNLAVHVLRSALGEGAIASAGDGLLFVPRLVRCDLHDLRAAIADGEHERVVKLFTGRLLDGFHLDESTEFAYWLDERRSELAHAYTGALLAVAGSQEKSGDVHGLVSTRRRLVSFDPHSAVYARALMLALDGAGDRTGAIQHAAEYAQRVRADLELEPDAGVMALAGELRAAPVRQPPPPPPRNGSRPASVAVLPFVSLSRDPDNEYFADGITEDVIAHLSKIRALRVISRTSVIPFRQRQHTVREIAERLGATTVLDGSVRHAGDRVRIVATLIDPANDQPLWVETYDRQLTDIFAIQTDVALRIAAALKTELSRDEQARVRREPTRDVEAYRLFLQGRRWFIRFNPEPLFRAIELFERAIQHDSTFALAFAHIAMAYTELAEVGAMPPDVAYDRAAQAVAKALELDPELGAAHSTLGHLKTARELDWEGAERAFKRAIELSPSSAEAYDLYGRLCTGLERYDDALDLLRRAQELDPLAHGLDIATALLRAGRYAEAVARAEDGVRLYDAEDRARATLGWAYFLSGRLAEGVAEIEGAVALAPGNTLWLGQLGAAYAMAGDSAKAHTVLRDLEQRARTAYVSPYHVAYVYSGLGDAERAMDWLERAVADRAGPVFGLKGSFLFASLRGNPRFLALLRQLKLA